MHSNENPIFLRLAKTVSSEFEQDGLFPTASQLWLSVVVVPLDHLLPLIDRVLPLEIAFPLAAARADQSLAHRKKACSFEVLDSSATNVEPGFHDQRIGARFGARYPPNGLQIFL